MNKKDKGPMKKIVCFFCGKHLSGNPKGTNIEYNVCRKCRQKQIDDAKEFDGKGLA